MLCVLVVFCQCVVLSLIFLTLLSYFQVFQNKLDPGPQCIFCGGRCIHSEVQRPAGGEFSHSVFRRS